MGYPYRVTWVATSPSGRWSPPPPLKPPYQGPPGYPAVPRWGFPRLSWREPTMVPGTSTRPHRTAERLVRHAHAAGAVLWTVAIAALLAAGGEIWRYTLLVIGRSAALSRDVVAVSDALVDTGALLSAVAGLVALGLVLRWLLTARDVAAERAGVSPARPDWQVLLGVLLPGLNLFVAGCVLAELEHTALRAGSGRPKPSRQVLAWWAAWVAGEVIAILTLLLSLRTGVQARADGVLWYATTDLVAAVTAVLTVRVVGAVTGLVQPNPGRLADRLRVIRVHGAPAPPLRAGRPAGATR